MIIPLSLISLTALLCLGLLASPYPYLAPAGVVGLAAALMLYRRPVWGLLAIAALVPLEGLLKDGQVSAAKLVGIGLVLVLGLQLAVRKMQIERLGSSHWRLLVPFLALCLLSLWTSEDQALSLGYLRELLVGLVVFVITLLLGRDLHLATWARLITISVCITCLFAIFSTRYQEQGRASAMLDPNAFALLISIAVPLALWLAIQARRFPTRLLWGAACLLLLAGMTKTESRSGLVVLFVSLVILLHNYRERLAAVRPRHLGFAMLGLAIVLPLGAVLMPEGYVERIQSLAQLKAGVNAHQDESLGRRASYLVVGKTMISQNPVLGTGPGTFPLHYASTGFAKAFAPVKAKTTDLYRRAHNTYLELVTEVGIPAVLLFVGMIVLALHNFWKARAAWRRSGNLDRADLMTHLTVSMLAIGMFLMFLSAPSHKLLWMMLALSSVLARQAEQGDWMEAER